MARPGTCSIGENTGFIKLQGPISTLLSSVAVNDIPLSLSFAPRTVAPSLLNNIINEGTDSITTNTVTYLANKYTLTSGIQLCNPAHTGYKLPDQAQVNQSAELFIPFVNAQIKGAYPSTVLLVVPVYQGSKSSTNSNYLKQLIDSNTPVASLQTIFYAKANDTSQVSLTYETCVDLSGSQYANILVYYFPVGITLKGQEYASLMRLAKAGGTSGTVLPDFKLPPASRSAFGTIRDYRLVDGVRKPITLSPDGLIYNQSVISTASNDFKERFIYYTKPPKLVGKFSEDNCPHYKTNQYKCVPFDKIQDLSGDYVIRGANSLESLLATQENARSVTTTSNEAKADAGRIALIVGGSIGGVLGLLGAFLGIRFLMNLGEETEE
jgi:hypothetical protein